MEANMEGQGQLTNVAEADVAAIQGKVAGVTVRRSVEFKGDRFKMAEAISHIVLMRFAYAADEDTDTDDMAALSAMYELLRDCIDSADWKRFERKAITTKADTDDLLPVVQQCVEALMARPTGEPSGSSTGQHATSQN